jgi:pyruvate ferredoxin oxidoreductase beta subunit
VEVVRLCVQAWAWSLYESEGGVLKVSLKPKRRSIEDYLKAQNRFRHLTDDQIQYVQSEVNTKRQRLLENDGKKVIL